MKPGHAPLDILTLSTAALRLTSEAFRSFLMDVDRAGIEEDLASPQTKALIAEAEKKSKELARRFARLKEEMDINSGN